MTAKRRWLGVLGGITVLALVVLLLRSRGDREPVRPVALEPPAPEVVAVEVAPVETPPEESAPVAPVEPEAPPVPAWPGPTETSRITGRILMYGRPPADAGSLTVQMTRVGLKMSKPEYQFIVGSDGFFRGEVLRQEYELTVWRSTGLIGTFTWEVLEPKESREFDLVDIYRLSGRVVDHAGNPLPAVSLDFSESRVGGGFHRVVTDASGSFETLLAAGRRTFVRLWSRSLGVVDLGAVTLTGDTTREFRLPVGSRVAGHISSESGYPLIDALVKLGNREARTDGSGNFEFTNVRTGRHRLGTWKEPYGLLTICRDLDVADGDDLWLDLTERLPVDGYVSGKVVSDEGKPLEGIRVEAGGSGGGYTGCLTKQDGCFRLRLYGEIGNVWANGDQQQGLGRAGVKVRPRDRDITLVLRPPVEFTLVYLLDGKPYVGPLNGQVEIRDFPFAVPLGSRTSPKGTQRFRVVPAGSYRMMCQFMRSFAPTEWVDIEVQKGRKQELVIDLVPGSRILLDFGSPFTGTYAIVDRAGSVIRARTLHTPVRIHQDNGPIVPAGTYEVLAFSCHGQAIVGEVKVVRDDCQTVSWKVYRCSTRVQVVDPWGRPVVGRSIRIRGQGGESDPAVPLAIQVGKLATGTILFEREAVTDEAGRCSFSGLLPATYVLGGHGGKLATVTLADGDGAHTEVILTAE